MPIGPGAGNPAAVAVVQPGMDRLRPLLALLVVATAAACAGDRDETIVDDDPWVEEPEPRAPGTPVPAEPVALVDVHHAGGHPPGAPTAVLVDEHDRMAYPGWFAADHPDAAEDIADVLAAPDPDPGTVLVAATVPLGCDSIGGVELLVAGSDIAVVPTGVTHHEECAGHRAVVAILEVDRSDLPASPTVDGEPVPVPPGPGELLAAVPLGPGEWDVPPADLADGRAAGSFTAALPADAVTAVEQAVDEAVAAHPEVRLPAFVLPGCRDDGAVLVVTPDAIRAQLVSEVLCAEPDWSVVVFGLAPELVPEGATLR